MVVDVQNDFIPVADAPSGGRFGVAEGAAAAEACVRLVQHFHSRGCLLVASKDYHPRSVQPMRVHAWLRGDRRAMSLPGTRRCARRVCWPHTSWPITLAGSCGGCLRGWC